MTYKQIQKSQIELELKQIKEWKEKSTFEKSLQIRMDKPPFIFYEGPPTANGKPGIHHILARTIKDIVCRYKTMKGFLVERKGGWDTHGLPVEKEVEECLNLCSKKDIEKLGICKFNTECKNSVFKYKSEWEKMTDRIGYWLDIENAYVTYTPEYIETVWYLLSQIWKKGLLFKDYKILPYCPRCGTGLSDHEEALGYKEVEDPSLTVKFQLKDKPNTFFLVWTTTPWTLLSNVALAVNPEEIYTEIKYKNENYILAKALVGSIMGDKPIEIIREFNGIELLNQEYIPLFDCEIPDKKAWYVVAADFVSMDDGTGIVHIAPAFGKEDFQLSKEYNLPIIQLVDTEGKIKEIVKPYSGMHFKTADNHILEDLKNRNILFKLGKIKHTYAFCWRCSSPLLQYAWSSWYIRTTAVKEQLLQNNSQINWVPPEIGKGRFGQWLENNIDWALSRQRYWGTPLNIWICEDCEKQFVPESFAQLSHRAANPLPEPFDPHKPYVDEVEVKCDKCGGVMKRVPDVIDCWFDSGAMPYAQHHYPFQFRNEEREVRSESAPLVTELKDFDRYFPADFISEGVDQTRGWFYTLLAISTLISNQPSYKNVLVVGLVMDKDGQKMSKSKGNAVPPSEVIDKYGADPLRYYLIATSQPWLPINFNTPDVHSQSWNFFETLKNVVNFFSLYADIDGFSVDNKLNLPQLKSMEIIDQWMLSRLESVKQEVIELLDNYQLTKALRILRDFTVDDLSNWYLRRTRRRYWGSGLTEEKKIAYTIFYHILDNLLKLLSPFIPMTADYCYRALNLQSINNSSQSVHLTNFPNINPSVIDTELEENMTLIIRLSSLGRAARAKSGIKVRQPLKSLIAITENNSVKDNLEIVSLLEDELNVKELIITSDETLFTQYTAKPNLAKVGKKYGKLIPAIKNHLSVLVFPDILKVVKLDIDGETIELIDDELLWEKTAKDGFVIESDQKYTVALDTHLTDELISEGYIRELINKVQQARKNAGFHPADRIILGIVSDETIKDSIGKFQKRLLSDTLTTDLQFNALEEYDNKEDVEINNRTATLYLKRSRRYDKT